MVDENCSRADQLKLQKKISAMEHRTKKKVAYDDDPTHKQLANLQSNLKRLLNLLMQVKNTLPNTPVIANIVKPLTD